MREAKAAEIYEYIMTVLATKLLLTETTEFCFYEKFKMQIRKLQKAEATCKWSMITQRVYENCIIKFKKMRLING